MELTREQLDALYDLTVVSDDGHTLGPVGHIYLDDQTQQATWITAKTGLFGLRQVFIPFQGARIEPEAIKVRYTKDYILDAPRFDTDGHISEAEQDELFGYFRVHRPGVAAPPHATEEQPQAQHDPAGPAPAQQPPTPVTEVPDQAAAHPQEVSAESEEVASYGALADPVAGADSLAEERDVDEPGVDAGADDSPEDAAGPEVDPEDPGHERSPEVPDTAAAEDPAAGQTEPEHGQDAEPDEPDDRGVDPEDGQDAEPVEAVDSEHGQDAEPVEPEDDQDAELEAQSSEDRA